MAVKYHPHWASAPQLAPAIWPCSGTALMAAGLAEEKWRRQIPKVVISDLPLKTDQLPSNCHDIRKDLRFQRKWSVICQ